MREGIVLYDRNGEAIWACANVDARASREVAELKEIHDYRFESEVYEVSGQTLALSAMPRLLWLAHHRPDIYRKAATITMISDWLAAKLSGELAVDPSNAGTTGMLDLFSRDWRPALLDMAGPVSYTHLDVYKRQVVDKLHLAGDAGLGGTVIGDIHAQRFPRLFRAVAAAGKEADADQLRNKGDAVRRLCGDYAHRQRQHDQF